MQPGQGRLLVKQQRGGAENTLDTAGWQWVGRVAWAAECAAAQGSVEFTATELKPPRGQCIDRDVKQVAEP